MSLNVTTLPNGIRVITDTVPSVETVALGVWFHAGARHEDMQYNGTAHMVEHMLFKGTTSRNALQIAEVIENAGGHMNAYTSREITSYHIHLLKEDARLALDVIADIVQRSTMPDNEVECERGVILQEIGMCNDTPDDIIFDHYFETAYPKQTIGAPILGTHDIISAMKRDTLMDFVTAQYTPSNLVVSASGNINHDDFVTYVTAAFTDLPDDTLRTETTAHYQGGERRTPRDLEQSHIIFGFKAPSLKDEKYYAARLLSMVAGGGMSSRLFQEIREKRGLVYSVYSFHSAYSDSGQFGVYAGTGPEKLPELVPVMCDELMKITHQITKEELNRAKAQLRSGAFMGLESMMRRADKNAKDTILHGAPRKPAEMIEKIDAVNVNDLHNAATEIFSHAPTLSALGPLDQLESFDKIKARLN